MDKLLYELARLAIDLLSLADHRGASLVLARSLTLPRVCVCGRPDRVDVLTRLLPRKKTLQQEPLYTVVVSD